VTILSFHRDFNLCFCDYSEANFYVSFSFIVNLDSDFYFSVNTNISSDGHIVVLIADFDILCRTCDVTDA